MAFDPSTGSGQGADASGSGGDVGGVDELLGAAAGGGGGDGGDGGGGGGEGDAGAGGEAAAGGAAPDWFDKVSAKPGEGDATSNRDWLTAKGVKDHDGLVKIARDTERALRESGRVKVPGDGAKPEEVAAFRQAIGVPDKVDGYEIKGPEGVPLNEPLIASLRESALKHGTPKEAFQGLVSDYIQSQMDEQAQATKAQDDQARDWLKEQGGKRDEQVAHINTAARSLGLTREEMTWFRTMPTGTGRALGLLAKLGAGMAEDVLITGGSNRFGVTGAEAKAEMDRLRGDAEFQKKVMVKGSPERVRWDRLNQQASEYQAAQAEGA